MRFVHRITMNAGPDSLGVLTRLGIGFQGPIPLASSFCWFEIAESHPAWNEVKSYLSEWDAGDNVRTIFTKTEMKNAPCWQMMPSWMSGYPQPEGDFGYQDLCFDKQLCKRCGIGRKQIAPMRLKGEPKWGKKGILVLIWIFDEFFARPEIWHEIFRPFGVKCRPVVHHKTGRELKTVVQLRIDAVATSPIALPPDHTTEECPECGQVKFHPIQPVGFYPNFVSPQTQAIFRSQEIFGSGGSASNVIFVGRDLFQRIRAMKPPGASFWPVSSRFCRHH